MIIDDETYQNRFEYCKEFIDRLCIWRSKDGETIPGKSEGHRYSSMFYLRRGLFHKDFMECVADMFVYKIEREIGHFDFQIAGLETASTPIVSAIPLLIRKYGIEIDSFSIRKNRKEYGLRNWFEGIPDPEKPVLLVDDLHNSAISLLKARGICYAHRLPLLDYSFTVVNKTNTVDKHKMSGDKYFKYADIPMKFISIYTLDDFTGVGFKPGQDMYMFESEESKDMLEAIAYGLGILPQETTVMLRTSGMEDVEEEPIATNKTFNTTRHFTEIKPDGIEGW